VALSNRVNPPSADVSTIELTGKRLKLHSLLSALAIIVGLVRMIANASTGQPSIGGMMASIGLMLGGRAWFVVTRIRI